MGATEGDTDYRDENGRWETTHYCAAGALLEERSPVCDGYTDAFKLLCNALGIPCFMIPGAGFAYYPDGTLAASHNWNYVKLEDGNWYFMDVPKNVWYADAVQWAVEREITNGTSTGTAPTFSPDMNCSRAQIVTFLHRLLVPPLAP